MGVVSVWRIRTVLYVSYSGTSRVIVLPHTLCLELFSLDSMKDFGFRFQWNLIIESLGLLYEGEYYDILLHVV